MSTLDELLNEPRGHRLRGCVLCGRTVEASVQVFIRKASPNGGVVKGNGGKSKSRTWALCAEHALDAYNRLTADLEPHA